MAAKGTSVTKSFSAIKKANPGMSDTEAMQRAIKGESGAVAREVKAHKKSARKVTWVEKLKMGVTKQLAKKRHSPAGRKHNSKKGY